MDKQGLMLKAKVHAASLFDRDGIKPLLERVEELFPCLSYLWVETPATAARVKARTG